MNNEQKKIIDRLLKDGHQTLTDAEAKELGYFSVRSAYDDWNEQGGYCTAPYFILPDLGSNDDNYGERVFYRGKK